MRPPNNDARALVANIGAIAAFSIIPLWIAAFLLALASCGAQPAANAPEFPDSSVASYSKNTNNCHDPLTDCQSLTDTLRVMGIPYPDVFARIAWAETQHGVTGVGEVNNLFGMQCADRACQDGCTANGYAVYAARIDAVSDLAMWVSIAPPHTNVGPDGTVYWEPAEMYLERRGWQPPHLMPRYWAYLQTLNQ